MKRIGFVFCCLFSVALTAQTRFANARTLEISPQKDSIYFSEVSISPVGFKIFQNNRRVDPKEYTVYFEKSLLLIDAQKYPLLTLHYTDYPEFLTKSYAPLDKNRIVANSSNTSRLFRLNNRKPSEYTPFEGLSTQGSLSRGITVGNNQDAVLNSNLDLQLSGKLSEKVTLNAAISDSNIPIQENGYSQRIEEFDRVFVELFTDDWRLKAGDVELSNTATHFLKFDKKVAGLSVNAQFGTDASKTQVQASGALVRGQFNRQQFQGIEGNQGPYKLQGANGEPYVVLLSGSETVYVNGLPLERGVQNQYTIDYNRAELTFTTTYPITAQMRITVEFQYSDKNYTRFVTYDHATYKSEKFQIGGYFYNENDAKNQPLQQNLSKEQQQLLSDAGNDPAKMVAPSAQRESYDENKILYTKEQAQGQEFFVFSQDPSAELYAVSFRSVDKGQGAYELERTTAIGKIYQYVGPFLGDYSPITQLVAPVKLQIAVANAAYKPNDKTAVHTEIAYSNHDKNLFSSRDDKQNRGIASKVGWTQTYADKKWLVQSRLDFDYIQQNFKSIQRIYNIEFARDWNLQNPKGNQEFLQASLLMSDKKNTSFAYAYESLKFGSDFTGNRHSFETQLQVGKTALKSNLRFLENQNPLENGTFLKTYARLQHRFHKTWLGASLRSENNQRKELTTQKKNPLSFKFANYGAHWGIGDSTKVYTKLGINYQRNDSLRNEKMTRVNEATNYYLQATWIQNKRAKLAVYLNYRSVNNRDYEDHNALNSRINYSQKLFENFVSWSSLYETSSGTSPLQEFAYIKTEPGQGYYTWIDYNNNQIQEFNEFEIANYSDQANYLRVALPSMQSVRMNQTKFSQSLNIDASQWRLKSGFKKFVSQFSNQSFVVIDRKKRRRQNRFDWNPFAANDGALLALQYQLKNNLFFRRGQQKYTTIYSISKSKTKQNLGIGFEENALHIQEIQFRHRLQTAWKIDLLARRQQTRNSSENYSDRAYLIHSDELLPTLTFNATRNQSFSLNYTYKTKEEVRSLSNLQVHNLGMAYQFSKPEKGSLIADLNLHQNSFRGDENSPIAYQMLEGLKNGNNYVWNVVLQKKLTKTLDLNLLYAGRKSENSNTIHTGNVQIRANF